MNQNEAQTCLYIAMSIGEQLLISGAEVGRVEDTIKRICLSYGAERVDVFSITSSIITTMYGPDFGVCTQTRRVLDKQNDFEKIDLLNDLSRQICSKHPKTSDIKIRLDEIEHTKKYRFSQQIFIYALISGSFTVLFGGSFMDMLVSACIGIILKILETFLKKHGRMNSMLIAFLCSSAGGFLANLFVLAGLGSHVDLINIGNIMLFIPGVAFTNSLRDMFSGDIITGLIRFIESILLAIVLAIGFTLANLLF